MNDWISILAGLVLLMVSAEILVRGSVWCALALGVSKMTVGLTLVAFGTSAPELFVGLSAAFAGVPEIATGAVLGSNIANIGLIIGLTALVKPIVHPPHSTRFEVGFLLLSSLLLVIPMLTDGAIDALEGVVLLLLLGFFTVVLVHREQRRRRLAEPQEPIDTGPMKIILNVAFVIGGLLGLRFGGGILVDGAEGVALSLGLSPILIGMTVVAIGTSLPELVTSVIAARRGHPELALGNILGSNVFNVCMVLGATSIVTPLQIVWSTEGTSVLVAAGFAGALAALLLFRDGIGRVAGAALLVGYGVFMALRIAQR